MTFRLTIIESPYAGGVERNLAYVRECMRDSLKRGEAPYASHALYTQPGVLDDCVPHERRLGIQAGFAWWNVAHHVAFYVDHGWSTGMRVAWIRVHEQIKTYSVRVLDQINDLDGV